MPGCAAWIGALFVIAAHYLTWEDAFEVDFEDGMTFLEPHSTIRKANKIAAKAQVERVELEDQCHAGFYVHYDNGQTAEVSWAFICELPPKKINPTARRRAPRHGRRRPAQLHASKRASLI